MRKLEGTIISNAMQKTVVVRVDRLKKHPRYHKQYRLSKKYKAHEETGGYHIGDIVRIEETRPMSKEKRWRVTQLVRRASAVKEEKTDVNSDTKEGETKI